MSRIFPSMFTAALLMAGAHGLNGTQPNDGARNIASLTDVSLPGFWRNEEWVELQLPEGASHGSTSSIMTYAGDVYVGGYCAKPKQGYTPGYWKNGAWTPLPSPNSSKYGSVSHLAIMGEHVYAAGQVSNVKNQAIPALWKNEAWVELPLPKAMNFGVKASGIAVTEKDVYVSANLFYTDDKSPLQDAGYWKNAQWTALQGPKDAKIANVDALFIQGSDLYAAGSYSVKAGLVNQPCYWKNGQCITPESCTGAIRAIQVMGGTVYAAGEKVNNLNERSFGYWKNSAWTPLTAPTGSKVTEIRSAYLSDESELFLVARVQNDKVSLPYYWRNGNWVSLQTPSGSTEQEVSALCIYNNDVYVAGSCWFSKKP